MEQELKNLILSTLSFYEPMTFSNIILDFDNDLLKKFPSFSKDDLHEILIELEKKKLVKRTKLADEIAWIKPLPKRPWWKRLFFL